MQPRVCAVCELALPLPRKISQKYHDDCEKSVVLRYNKQRWKNMTAVEKASNNMRRTRLSRTNRTLVLQHYGGACACCGETAFEFLCIDHVNGGGSQHRKSIGFGYNFYKWLIDQGFPGGFRVLCHNCNM